MTQNDTAKLPAFRPVGDRALLLTYSDTTSHDVSDAIVAADRCICAAAPKGLCEVIPALVNLLVVFDPLETDHDQIEADLRTLLSGMTAVTNSGTLRAVDVCFDPAVAPDLAAVAAARGMTEEAFRTAFLAGTFTVRMYGFAPGYAYMSGVPEAIQVPRKPAAVRDVPAGSVIFAGNQCLVTTLTMPTGWSIIGHSPTQILSSRSERPFLLDVGDRVEFHQIGAASLAVAKEARHD
ncbi:MAG: carboxyltransferase domain-containing protein [Pseudomonadota bacterium]|nr:carboxyltransferase domain-containing protein [Pseudomonadota bacterium]